jgi:hypothetical protein
VCLAWCELEIVQIQVKPTLTQRDFFCQASGKDFFKNI